MESTLDGLVIVISDNEAVIAAACNNSPHSGFTSSLAICKLLFKWFRHLPHNQIQFRWFPGHEGLVLNELADSLAGQELPCVNPPIVATTASRQKSFMVCAVNDWRLQALPLIHACPVQLKVRRDPLQPQLWGTKGKQLFDLAGNDINLFGRFT